MKYEAEKTEQEHAGMAWGIKMLEGSDTCVCHILKDFKPEVQTRIKSRVLWWDYSTADTLYEGQLKCDICNKPDNRTRSLRQVFPGVERHLHSWKRCPMCARDGCVIEKVRCVIERRPTAICHGCYHVMRWNSND